MPVLTLVALAVSAAVAVAALSVLLRAAARRLRERRPHLLDRERSSASVDAEYAGTQRPAESRESAQAQDARQTQNAQPSHEPLAAHEPIAPREPLVPDEKVVPHAPMPAEPAVVAPVDEEEPAPAKPAEEPHAEPVEPHISEPPRPTVPPMVAAAIASEPKIAARPAPVSAPPPAPAPSPVAARVDRALIEADDPERKKARKLARLLVSEIKLYNERLVAESFATGELYTRLKEPIDQSFIVFQRRVPEAVRAEFDYMHDELVRQLAKGDVNRLGSPYAALRRS